jgi:FlaA1/EpsC-like NDP-sugar epimerase
MNLDNLKNHPRRELAWLRAKWLFLLCDIVVLAAAFVLAYLLRFDFDIPADKLAWMKGQLPYVLAIQLTALILTGVYTIIWRYIGIIELKAFAVAALTSALPLVGLRVLLPDTYVNWRVPYSVTVMAIFLGFGSVLGLRVIRRAWYERRFIRRNGRRLASAHKRPVLLIGAGRAGVMTAKEIINRGNMDLVIRGFVDDDPEKQGSTIHRIRVVGTIADLPRLVKDLKIDHVIIAIAQATREQFQAILDTCEKIPVKARIIPGLYEILQEKVQISRIRDVQVEDLLGREPVNLNEEEMGRFLQGKSVIVTGAGGSIGSELSRQVARFRPSSLLLVERAEFALFNIHHELRSLLPNQNLVPLVADIGDESRMSNIFRKYRPQVVIHAAAHKHVPMMEWNSVEAVKNNILGTRCVGELAGRYGAQAFVLISTDKAVRPTSVMGACKRVAELVIQNLNDRHQTRYVAVRFGNVIGSSGSVIPIFREQIRRGGPITVTHPDMTRYFMTIPEAAQLVLQAGAMAEGGEIFVLDMGAPVRILDIARQTIILSGLKPDEDIKIAFTGIRPGEKLFEELEVTGENMLKTRHPKIFIGNINSLATSRVEEALEWLEIYSHGVDGEQDLRRLLAELAAEHPTELAEALISPRELLTYSTGA